MQFKITRTDLVLIGYSSKRHYEISISAYVLFPYRWRRGVVRLESVRTSYLSIFCYVRLAVPYTIIRKVEGDLRALLKSLPCHDCTLAVIALMTSNAYKPT